MTSACLAPNTVNTAGLPSQRIYTYIYIYIYICICMHTQTYLTTDALCMYADGCISKKAICADAHTCPHIHMLCMPICMCLQTCKQVTRPTCLDEDITATYMIHSSFQHRHAHRVRSSSCACQNTQTTACSRDTLS